MRGLIERVEVSRSPSVDQSAQAIAGSVNIVLRRTARTTQRDIKLAGARVLERPTASVDGNIGDRDGPWAWGLGVGLDRVMHAHKADMTTFPATLRAARQAFAMARLGPSDIDVAELHDCFTGVELMTYEDLGFCDRGGAPKLIESGDTAVGGRLPVNPSGGLKAKGHPPGATGVAQCVEIFEQLRGAAANQVEGARIGLCHNIGGPTAVSAVTILEGPGR